MAEPRHKQTSHKRHGLRVTVCLFGSVLSQKVWWPGSGPVVIGATIDDAIPTPSGGPLLRARWTGPAAVSLSGVEPGVDGGALAPGERWTWGNDSGVDVTVDLVPLQRAQRRSEDVYGDAALLTLMLMLMVGVGQARFLWQVLMPEGGGGAIQTQMEPSPELIARLLERDLEGAEEAYASERTDRPEYTRQLEQEFLPSGSDGPQDRAGGGEQAGDEIQREEGADAVGTPERTLPQDEAPVEDAPETPPAPEAPELQLAELEGEPELELVAPDPEPVAASELKKPGNDGTADVQRPEAVERFVGWGFRDWFDVADARRESVEELSWQLEMVRQRMKINPDDPYALNLLGNYAYLAENMALSRQSYQRYIDLYPEESLGYNNLALTYKREGDYAEEERLYRAALELHPDNPNVLNNLAVNLAHQGSLEEALELMVKLETLDPDNPYTDLHRAKIYAVMGDHDKAYRYLRLALEGAEGLTTLHHIEFRQDIRLEPAFDGIRTDRRFARVMRRFYGEDADYLIEGGKLSDENRSAPQGGPLGRWGGGGRG